MTKAWASIYKNKARRCYECNVYRRQTAQEKGLGTVSTETATNCNAHIAQKRKWSLTKQTIQPMDINYRELP